MRSYSIAPGGAGGHPDKDEIPDEEDFEVIPRAISVIVGQGSALNWPVDAVLFRY